MNITLLDGGMGQELVHRSGLKPTALWSTQIMIDRPGMVAEVHRDFLSAGATVMTTNTYATHADRLTGTAMEGQQEDLIARAVAEAKAARVQHPSAKLAGSIGPLIASYRPDIHPPHAEAVAKYAHVAQALADECDILILETVSSIDHARAILEAAATTDLPLWIGLSVDDDKGTYLRSGEALADALPHLGAAEAVMVNCSTPEAVSDAMPVLATCGKPFGAYANGFTKISDGFLQDKPTVDALSARQDLSPEAYAACALSWVEHGATLIGGCCEISPAHIATLAEALRAAGHTIT